MNGLNFEETSKKYSAIPQTTYHRRKRPPHPLEEKNEHLLNREDAFTPSADSTQSLPPKREHHLDRADLYSPTDTSFITVNNAERHRATNSLLPVAAESSVGRTANSNNRSARSTNPNVSTRQYTDFSIESILRASDESQSTNEPAAAASKVAVVVARDQEGAATLPEHQQLIINEAEHLTQASSALLGLGQWDSTPAGLSTSTPLQVCYPVQVYYLYPWQCIQQSGLPYDQTSGPAGRSCSSADGSVCAPVVYRSGEGARAPAESFEHRFCTTPFSSTEAGCVAEKLLFESSGVIIHILSF